MWRNREGWDNWSGFVLELLGHGVAFEWTVPDVDITPLSRVPPLLSWMHTDPVFRWWSRYPDSIQKSWEWTVAEVLGRLHATWALTSGGILWRLAVEFGSANLLQDAVCGPSLTTTLYRRGQAYSFPVSFSGDHLSRVEMDALIGCLDCG